MQTKPQTISRRRVTLAGGGALLLASGIDDAQATDRIRQVGILSLSSESASAQVRASFIQGMNELGWQTGRNIEYRLAYAAGDLSRMDSLARELIGSRVDVILATSPPATRIVQRATKTLPIVMAYGSNAVETQLVASLARPGANITGISDQIEETLAKLIGILREIVPAARRIAVMLNESHPAHPLYWASARNASATAGLEAIRVVANAPDQLETAVEQIVRYRSQAILVVSDPMFFAERAKLQEVMQVTRLPAAYGFREHVLAGGLLSYASSLTANFRYAAKFVDKILRGAKPADIPVEQPTRFELVINLKTAKNLGIRIPQTVLLQADEVID